MASNNKWRFEGHPISGHRWKNEYSSSVLLPQASSHVTQTPDGLVCDSLCNEVPTLNLRSRSVTLLRDSLRDLGLDELNRADLESCPEGVISLVWKLVSECQQGVRQFQQAKEGSARIENENKQLKSRVSRQAEDLGKLRSELKERENEFRRKEEALQAKIDDLGKNRFEWEKTALTYKGREKKFVAEMKKQESEYERLQDRMRRSFSHSRYSPPPPPLAPSRPHEEWIPRLNLR